MASAFVGVPASPSLSPVGREWIPAPEGLFAACTPMGCGITFTPVSASSTAFRIWPLFVNRWTSKCPASHLDHVIDLLLVSFTTGVGDQHVAARGQRNVKRRLDHGIPSG